MEKKGCGGTPKTLFSRTSPVPPFLQPPRGPRVPSPRDEDGRESYSSDETPVGASYGGLDPGRDCDKTVHWSRLSDRRDPESKGRIWYPDPQEIVGEEETVRFSGDHQIKFVVFEPEVT